MIVRFVASVAVALIAALVVKSLPEHRPLSENAGDVRWGRSAGAAAGAFGSPAAGELLIRDGGRVLGTGGM